MRAVKNQFKLDVEVKTLRTTVPFSLSQIKGLIQAVLKKERIRAAHLSVLLVSDPFIRRLNKNFLSKDSPTDVLSFDLHTGKFRRKGLTGDIVVSVDAARLLSRTLKIPLKEEIGRYIIHGILHLTGYDDTTPVEKKSMWKRQEKLLKECL